jgi:hypothetical protein
MAFLENLSSLSKDTPHRHALCFTAAGRFMVEGDKTWRRNSFEGQ